MKRTIVYLIIALLFTFSCDNKLVGPGFVVEEDGGGYNVKVAFEGKNREFKIYLPENVNDKVRPLIVVLHGFGSDPFSMNILTKWDAKAKKEGAILVYPKGAVINGFTSWNDLGTSSPANSKNINDVGFIKLILDFVSSQYQIDPHKIFCVGISNGGFMATTLAYEMGDIFAACAAVAATVNENYISKTPTTPVSMLFIHGTKDNRVEYNGAENMLGMGAGYASHLESIKKWAENNQCDLIPITEELPLIEKDGGTSIIKRTYKNGSHQTEVVGYTVVNGGHTWPGGFPYTLNIPFLGGLTSKQMNATDVLWDFFETHPK